MGRVPGLTLERRQQALGMLDAGMPVNDVANHFGVQRCTVSRLRTRYQQTGSAKDPPRSGRPKKTNQRENNYIVTSSRRHRGVIDFGRVVRLPLGCTTLQGRSFAIGLCATDCERQDYVPTDPTLGCRCHNATARKGSTGRYFISDGHVPTGTMFYSRTNRDSPLILPMEE